MATEGREKPDVLETILIEAKTEILKRCEKAGMQANQLLILKNVLRNVDNTQSEKVAERWEIIDGQTFEGQQKIADIFGQR